MDGFEVTTHDRFSGDHRGDPHGRGDMSYAN